MNKLIKEICTRLLDSKFEDFCKRRKEEKYVKNQLEIENVNILYDKLKKIKSEIAQKKREKCYYG